MTPRLAVLASGGGSNFEALCEYFASRGQEPSAWIRLVASDRAEAGVLDRARARGIEALHLDGRSRADGLAELLGSRAIDLVVLAGYLRLVPDVVTTHWRGRIVNVHPALLPAFGGEGMYGRRVHAAVLAQGVRVTGVTVHFVDAQYDHGPLIAQWPVPVHAADTPETLGARVLEVEHQLYPRVVALLAAGRITLDERGGVAGLPAPWRFPHFAAADEPGAGDVWDPALSPVA